MDENIELNKIRKSKEINKNFSMYDYIYHEITENKIDSDIYFALLEFYWPTFYAYKNYILLKEQFSERKFNENISQNNNIEFWMNLFILDPYFQNDDNSDLKSKSIAKILSVIWRLKLKHDFPELDFIVEIYQDEEVGDYGLTFYQSKYKNKKLLGLISG